MKKEQFTKLGFTEDMAEKAVDILREELKGYIPKSRFDQVNEVKKELERKLATLEVQRKEQNASKLSHQELEKIIRDILSTNAAIKAEQEAKMKDLLKELAIRHTLGKFQYTDLLIGMFDKSRLSVADDGTVTGIKEQLEEIKTSYEGLFRI
jgi:thioredoxin-related protein